MSVAELLIPNFALIALGYALRRYAGFSQEFWTHLERLVYYVLFPALLFGALAPARLELASVAALIETGAGFTIAGMVLGYAAKFVFDTPPMSFASAFQCAFRFNSYIGFAVIGGLHGVDGIAAFALLAGFVVPFVNLVSVWALARHGTGEWWKEIVRNPLILATAAGLAWAALGLPLPQTATVTLRFLGESALPMGLIAVGAGLQLRKLTHRPALTGYLSVVKLLMVPAVAYAAGHWLGLGTVYFNAALVLAALPTASSAYILAVRMGGDGPLVASIITLNIVAAAATLPLWIALRAV